MQESVSIQGLKGKVTILRGDRQLVKRLCMSLSLKLQEFSHPIFIDSGNAFNPYMIQKMTRDPKAALNNILISRPFTIHQLKTLVCNLPDLCESRKVVIISSIDHLFRDADMREGEFVLEEIMAELQFLTRKFDLITIVGYTGGIHFSLIENYVDVAYTI